MNIDTIKEVIYDYARNKTSPDKIINIYNSGECIVDLLPISIQNGEVNRQWSIDTDGQPDDNRFIYRLLKKIAAKLVNWKIILCFNRQSIFNAYVTRSQNEVLIALYKFNDLFYALSEELVNKDKEIEELNKRIEKLES